MDNNNQRQILANESDDVSRAQENHPNYFDTLSDELHLEIFKRLPQYELESLALVSTRFNRIIEDRTLWKNVFRQSHNLKADDVEKLMRRPVQYLSLCELTIPPLLPALEGTPSWCLKEVCLSQVKTDPENLVRIFIRCRQLTKVELSDVSVNKYVFVALSQNQDLEILHLTSVCGVEPVYLGILLRNARKLQEFYIVDLENENFGENLNLAPSLLRLTLSYTMEDRDIAHIVKRCPLLRTLKLQWCHRLTEISTESLRNLRHLRQLGMLSCLHIPPAAFFALANELENLEELSIEKYRKYPEKMREMREIEQVFSVNILEDHQCWKLGTFTTRFGVVRLVY